MRHREAVIKQFMIPHDVHVCWICLVEERSGGQRKVSSYRIRSFIICWLHEEYVGLEEKTEFAGAGGIWGRQGKVALSEEVPERGKETAILWGASYAS